MKNKIKDFRKKKNLSQLDLALKCNVTRQTINAVENDKYDPSLSLAFLIASTLNVKVDELFIHKKETI